MCVCVNHATRRLWYASYTEPLVSISSGPKHPLFPHPFTRQSHLPITIYPFPPVPPFFLLASTTHAIPVSVPPSEINMYTRQALAPAVACSPKINSIRSGTHGTKTHTHETIDSGLYYDYHYHPDEMQTVSDTPCQILQSVAP